MPVGVLGGLAIGAGTLGSALIGANAAKKAASQQAAALSAASQQLKPFSLPGQGAAAALAQMYGIDPATGALTGQPMSPEALAAFERSPDYAFARQEGIRGVEFSNAARGLARSGTNIRGVTEYASGLATQNFNNYRNALLALAQLGAGAASGSASMTAQAGGALASGTVGAANAWSGALGSLGNYFMLQSLMSPKTAGDPGALGAKSLYSPSAGAPALGVYGTQMAAQPGFYGAFPSVPVSAF
jgi:hypothetical protein